MSTTIISRISSTQLNDFARCARLWAFVHAQGEDSGVGYAAAVGTVVHAMLEHRLLHGDLPTRAQVMAMPGNYEDPGESITRYDHKGIWAEAVATAEAVGDPWQHLPPEWEEVTPELDLERWDINIGATRCGGYIDVWGLNRETNTALLFDWKTRGKSSWRYRPSSEAMPTNRQLLYYASVARQALGVDAIDVYHGNILRAGEGTTVVDVIGARILAHEADAFFAELTEKTLPAMRSVRSLWESPKQRAEVPGDHSNCFMYGPCPHMSRCNALETKTKGSYLDRVATRAAEQDAL